MCILYFSSSSWHEIKIDLYYNFNIQKWMDTDMDSSVDTCLNRNFFNALILCSFYIFSAAAELWLLLLCYYVKADVDTNADADSVLMQLWRFCIAAAVQCVAIADFTIAAVLYHSLKHLTTAPKKQYKSSRCHSTVSVLVH